MNSDYFHEMTHLTAIPTTFPRLGTRSICGTGRLSSVMLVLEKNDIILVLSWTRIKRRPRKKSLPKFEPITPVQVVDITHLL